MSDIIQHGGGRRPTVLVQTLTPFAREPRALKQVEALRGIYDVTTAGFGPAPFPDLPHIELDPSPTRRGLFTVPGFHTLLNSLRMYGTFGRLWPRNRDALRRLRGHRFDLVVAHDVASLPIATRLDSRAGFVLDLHEYAPRQGEHSARWMRDTAPYFRWLLRTLAPRAKRITTVGQGIVEEYRREFGLETTLAINATPFRDGEPGPVAHPLRLVHSGIAAPTRKLDLMIDAVRLTATPVTLDLYLVDGGDGHLQELRDLAGDDARITFHDPVPYASLVDTLAQYDVGLSIIAPSTFNLAWCLPNKFFDFIQARLGVIIGPSPEMARFVEEYGIGAVAVDFTPRAIADVLDALDPSTVADWKAASHAHAHALSSESQAALWQDVAASALREAGRP